MEIWFLAALLGIGLAAATGLRTFLPLLLLSAAVHFGWFGISVNESMQWVGSTGALVALAIATLVEVVADLVPYVDNLLSTAATVIRPVAGALAAWAAFSNLDPAIAALAGIVIGAPTALAVGATQTTTRAASTVTTGGLANPAVSVLDTVLSFAVSVISLLAPVLVIPIVVIAIWIVIRVFRRVRAGRERLAWPRDPAT